MSLLLACTLSILPHAPAEAPREPAPRVRVVVLAGQSNMEGKGFPDPVAWQVGQEAYRDRWTRIIEDGDHAEFTRVHAASLERDPKRPEYRWSKRDDVLVRFLGKRGPLTVGYGVPDKAFGPELFLGQVLGEHFDDPVLLIKAAWGGKTLAIDFRPPSAGLPSDEALAARREQHNAGVQRHNEKNPDRPRPLMTEAEQRAAFGHFYRQMMDQVSDTLTNLDTQFPALAGHEPVMEGFVWFQGWNDQFEEWGQQDYGRLLACLGSDVRAAWSTADLPIVVGVVGFDGPRNQPLKNGEKTPRTLIQEGQRALPTLEAFEGSAAAVETAPFWDLEADAIFHGPGGWSADVARWQQFGNDRPYHYLGSPWFFAQAGEAFGEALVRLSTARAR
jgi:hypothetical protein